MSTLFSDARYCTLLSSPFKTDQVLMKNIFATWHSQPTVTNDVCLSLESQCEVLCFWLASSYSLYRLKINRLMRISSTKPFCQSSCLTREEITGVEIDPSPSNLLFSFKVWFINKLSFKTMLASDLMVVVDSFSFHYVITRLGSLRYCEIF